MIRPGLSRASLRLGGVLLLGLVGIGFAADLVDINSATPDQLKTLPGMNEGYVMMIVGARPFQSKEDLVQQKILTQEAYDQIKDKIFVKGGGAARPSSPSAVPMAPPQPMSGVEAGGRGENADVGPPSGASSSRVCIKEERTKQIMCGEATR